MSKTWKVACVAGSVIAALAWLINVIFKAPTLMVPGLFVVYFATGGVHDLNFFGDFILQHTSLYFLLATAVNIGLYSVAAFPIVRFACHSLADKDVKLTAKS